MKTESEIKQWMKERKIYGRLMNYNHSSRQAGVWISPFKLSKGVDNCRWEHTPEGFGFWKSIDTEFLLWL